MHLFLADVKKGKNEATKIFALLFFYYKNNICNEYGPKRYRSRI